MCAVDLVDQRMVVQKQLPEQCGYPDSLVLIATTGRDANPQVLQRAKKQLVAIHTSEDRTAPRDTDRRAVTIVRDR